MQFRLFLFVIAATLLAATTASANIIQGFKVPSTITKGEPFTLQYKTKGATSGPTVFYAAYGFQLTAQNHTGSLGGYLLNGTDFKDLAQHENLRGDFNVSLLLPNNDASSYVEGQRMFSVALYGVEEALNYPQVFLYNQTVTVK